MGICLTANKSTYSFDMSSGGFNNLRKNIATALNEDFGIVYGDSTLEITNPKLYEKKINEKLSCMPDDKDTEKILDFLFASDIEGCCDYRTCKNLYNLIKDIDFGTKIFTYAAYSDGKDYEKFKLFLKECYSHRRTMYWR